VTRGSKPTGDSVRIVSEIRVNDAIRLGHIARCALRDGEVPRISDIQRSALHRIYDQLARAGMADWGADGILPPDKP
jgi:hypothetical protein